MNTIKKTGNYLSGGQVMEPKSIFSSAVAQDFYTLSNENLSANPHQAICPGYDLFMKIIPKFPALLFPPLSNPIDYLSLVSFLQIGCSKSWTKLSILENKMAGQNTNYAELESSNPLHQLIWRRTNYFINAFTLTYFEGG